MKIKYLGCVIVMSLLSGCGERTPEEKAAYNCNSGTLHYIYTRDFIKNTLVSPSTAKFPSYQEIAHKELGECRHEFTGYVDAQNSFGGVIRKKYKAITKFDKARAC